jgi:hypothetical protein
MLEKKTIFCDPLQWKLRRASYPKPSILLLMVVANTMAPSILSVGIWNLFCVKIHRFQIFEIVLQLIAMNSFRILNSVPQLTWLGSIAQNGWRNSVDPEKRKCLKSFTGNSLINCFDEMYICYVTPNLFSVSSINLLFKNCFDIIINSLQTDLLTMNLCNQFIFNIDTTTTTLTYNFHLKILLNCCEKISCFM